MRQSRKKKQCSKTGQRPRKCLYSMLLYVVLGACIIAFSTVAGGPRITDTEVQQLHQTMKQLDINRNHVHSEVKYE